jgi:hypothetical protein
MRASETITAPGDYRLRVANPSEDSGGSPFPLRLYRNRTRLVATDTLHEVVWRGTLAAGDLIEADGDQDVRLSVEVIAHAEPADPRDDPNPGTLTVEDITEPGPTPDPPAA